MVSKLWIVIIKALDIVKINLVRLSSIPLLIL